MRTYSWILSGLLGCVLLILLWLVMDRLGNSRVPTAGRERRVQPSLPQSPPPEPIAPISRTADEHARAHEIPENLEAEKEKGDGNREVGPEFEEWLTDVETSKPPPPPLRTAKKPRSRAGDPAQPPLMQGFPIQGFPIQGVPGQGIPGQPPVRPPFVEKKKKGARAAVSNLPKNIPLWFKEYDANGDGQVSLAEWKEREASTGEFHKYDLNGDGYISLAELIRSGQFVTAMPTPQVVAGLGSTVGDFYYFEVTGTTQGVAWGTDVYTTDSPIALVAVHAGILREGETGLVRVTIMPGQQLYDGSVANGVTTQDRHTGFYKSYSIEGVR